MADFEQVVTKMLGIEGVYSNDPDDYGGETKFGIAKKYYPELDIKNLQLSQAKAIYKADYWDKLRLDEIKEQDLAWELFDIAVNLHWSRAAKFLQEGLNLLYKTTLKIDGLLGEKTLNAANMVGEPWKLVAFMNRCQFEHYHKRVHEDPSQRKFFRGWFLRTI
jgi:lysozyme family protein